MDGQAVSDDAVRAIQESVKTETITVSDGEYATRQVFIPPAEPTAARLSINTLQGVVDFLSANKDNTRSLSSLHIVSAQRVDVIGVLAGRHNQRAIYVTANSDDILGKTFRFDHFYELEEMIIALQCLFGQTETREHLLKILGNIRDSNIKTASDDGVTQTVEIKSGIVMGVATPVPNPVELVPFRTFREIEQPPSPFVLRLRQGREGCLPTAALFEADGGQWQLEAINSIKEFLESKLEGVPIIA